MRDRIDTLHDLHASRTRLSVGQIDFLFKEIDRLRKVVQEKNDALQKAWTGLAAVAEAERRREPSASAP